MSTELDPDEREEILERASEALDEGRLEDVLQTLEALPLDDSERLFQQAMVYLVMGDLVAARRSHDALIANPEATELPIVRLLSAELLVAEWRVDEALAILTELDPEDPDVLDQLALCRELTGDYAESDRLYARVLELSDDPPIPRLSSAEFDAVVTEAIDGLPHEHRRALELAEVIVEPMPSLELAALWQDPADLGETPPGMLGLFVGASEIERDPDAPEPPPRIFLFQRNLERLCLDRAELLSEIRTTFHHELAHLLGFDEDGVAELGLE